MHLNQTLLLLLLAIAGYATAAPLNNGTTTTAGPLMQNSTKPAAIPTVPRGANATRLFATHRGRNTTEGEYWYLRRAGEGCLHNEGVNRCLDVEQSRKTVKYSDAQMWSCNLNPDAQKFSFYGSVDWSSVYIVANGAGPAPEYADYCLDVTEGKMVNGQAVRWWECNRSDAQRWTWNREHGFISPVLRPDLCLDPMGGIAEGHDGQGMQLWSCVRGERGHMWKVDAFRKGSLCGPN